MKVLHQADPWPTKVNFVDENNVILGYDLNSKCCETADWFIADVICDAVQNRDTDNPELPDWHFDTGFFKKVELQPNPDSDSYGVTYAAVFRIHMGDQEKFIHIYNTQNGYYGHDFEFESENELKIEGSL